MTLTVVILLLGGVFFASLLAIGFRSERRRGHPWQTFADRHRLRYRTTRGEHRIEGERYGRDVLVRAPTDGTDETWMSVAVPLRIDDVPEAKIRRPGQEGIEEDCERLEVAESEERSPMRLLVRGEDDPRSFLEGTEEGARLLELQRAEPRLEYVDGRLRYRSSTVVLDRKEFAELLDRMVDSARHIEGVL